MAPPRSIARAAARVAATLAPLLLLAPVACVDDAGDAADARAERQAEVARRGATVMPFDLDATTHTFTTTADGGVQDVTVDDPRDAEQLALVREHLRSERDAFARGDFDDPAAIHGHDMDGVAELREGYRDISVSYTELVDGARLTYTTERADLVAAVHAWFDRQVVDHGAHAESG